MPIVARVCGPTTPSATSPCRRCQRFTARSVAGPKTPSAVTPTFRWTFRTSPRLLDACAFTSALAPAGAAIVAPHTSASAIRTETDFLCTAKQPSVGFRLRGELTGSRGLRYARAGPGRFAPAARRPHRFPRSPHPEVGRLGVRTGRFLSTTLPFFLQAARFVAECPHARARPRHLPLDRKAPEHRRRRELVLDS